MGPADNLGAPDEVLPEPPSRWYLTGFLAPFDAGETQRGDEGSTDGLDAVNDARGLDDAVTPEPAAARRSFYPSSAGMSFLIKENTKRLQITCRWGDYQPEQPADGGMTNLWRRSACTEAMTVEFPGETRAPVEREIPNSGGLKVAISVRSVQSDGKDGGIPKGCHSVSVFLVNRRKPSPDEERDVAFAFQVQLEVYSDQPFVPRPNLRSLESQDWDECVADLLYCDDCEYAAGHNVSTEAVLTDSRCNTLRTTWIPQAEVERVAPTKIDGVTLSMDTLAQLEDANDAQAKLGSFVTQYREWIEAQKAKVPKSPKKRRETGEELSKRANVAAGRIETGIALLSNPECLEAFRIANRAMAAAARQRQAMIEGKDLATITPTWRPFQLAFLLMNLPGIANPKNVDRTVVDLLFFPTGGGKTEAYLPNHSMLVGGLDYWTGPGEQILEPRLIAKLQAVLELPALKLHAPPPDQADPTAPQTGINAWQFPEWFITQDIAASDQGRAVRSRMLVHRKFLSRGKFIDQDKKKRAVVPVRFVRACPRGHIGDIDWRSFVHGGEFYDPRSLDLEAKQKSCLHAKCIVVDGKD